jgi:hypothetical protein
MDEEERINRLVERVIFACVAVTVALEVIIILVLRNT